MSATATNAKRATPPTKRQASTTADDRLPAKEKELIKKYGKRVQAGTIRQEEDGTHAGKITVEIKCEKRGCKNLRRVATSDLFQVKLCLECSAAAKKARRKAKVKTESNAERAALDKARAERHGLENGDATAWMPDGTPVNTGAAKDKPPQAKK